MKEIFMKKKVIFFISLAIIVIAAVLAVFIVTRPKILGNMSNSFSSPETTTQSFLFSGKECDTVKIVFSSDVKSGELNISIFDSKGNTVKTLDKAKELRTYLTLDRSETYTCKASRSEMVGSFNVKVYDSLR